MNKVIVFIFFVGLAAAAPNSNVKRLKTRLTTVRDDNRLGIFDGKKTTIAQHNYQVSILQHGSSICAGVIVSKSYVLTQGDCVYGTTASENTVIAASNDGITGKSYKVKSITIHPKYSESETFNNDFALVEVQGSFAWGSTVGNVSLPSTEVEDNTVLTVAGWGDTSDVDITEAKATMRQGNMKWMPKSTCKSAYKNYFKWTKTMGCAYNKGKTTLCEGDFGDAFVKDGVVYGLMLGGITTGFCSSDALPIIVNDVYPVVGWIKGHIKP